MELYRVQSRDNAGSMWYNPDGTSNRIVDRLTSDRLAKLPMEYDSRYREGGKIWQCAAWDIRHLNQWFSRQDMMELIDMNFHVVRFNAKEYVKEENQVIFTMKSVFNVEDITDYTVKMLNGEV